MEASATVMFRPCLHTVLCTECAADCLDGIRREGCVICLRSVDTFEQI
jgi:hypothetical protein